MNDSGPAAGNAARQIQAFIMFTFCASLFFLFISGDGGGRDGEGGNGRGGG